MCIIYEGSRRGESPLDLALHSPDSPNASDSKSQLVEKAILMEESPLFFPINIRRP